jgi:hypothetical protein
VARQCAAQISIGIFISVLVLFAFFILRIVLRHDWAAIGLFVIYSGGLRILGVSFLWATIPAIVVSGAVRTFVLVRIGLVAAMVDGFVWTLFMSSPMTLQTSAWYAGGLCRIRRRRGDRRLWIQNGARRTDDAGRTGDRRLGSACREMNLRSRVWTRASAREIVVNYSKAAAKGRFANAVTDRNRCGGCRRTVCRFLACSNNRMAGRRSASRCHDLRANYGEFRPCLDEAHSRSR